MQLHNQLLRWRTPAHTLESVPVLDLPQLSAWSRLLTLLMILFVASERLAAFKSGQSAHSFHNSVPRPCSTSLLAVQPPPGPLTLQLPWLPSRWCWPL